MKNIYVIRHCQAEGQAAHAQLTEQGRLQAEQLTEFLLPRNIDYILSSPYERACRTISGLAEKLGMGIATDDRLTERVLSIKDDPNWRDMLRKTYDDLDLCYDGGESSRAAMNRVISVVKEQLHSRYDNIIMVSHGNLISLLFKYCDNRFGYGDWENLSNPDVFRLTYVKDVPAIERIWIG